jgi:hypothetical protein
LIEIWRFEQFLTPKRWSSSNSEFGTCSND